MLLRFPGWLLSIGLLAGCASAEAPSANPPIPSRATFDTVIYPILARDCSFPACHASQERFFRVHAPNRGRLRADTALSAPTTGEEMEMAWERTRSMLSAAESPEESLLLRKPLELDEGGAPHMGVDQYGRDVFADRDDPSYIALLEWARGAAPPAPGPGPGPVDADAGAGGDPVLPPIGEGTP